MALINKKCAVMAASLMLSGGVSATEMASGVYLAPGIHYQDVFGNNILDNEFGMDGSVGLNLGLGYQFDSPWAVEFLYHHTKTDITRTSKTQATSHDELSTNYGHLDVLYHMPAFTDSKWSPYVVGGVGRQAYSNDFLKKADAQFNAGVGLKYAMSSNLFFRTDLRGTVGTREGDVGGILTMGLLVIFGETRTAPARTEPVVQQAQPAPVVAEETVVIVPVVVVDSDGDGVPDHLDQCPGTTPGAKVDENGCYELLTEIREFTLNVTFATGSSNITADSKGDVRELADFLKSYPGTNVVIEGHSDSTGPAELNLRLSQQRADAVKRSLVDEFGIREGRVSSVGYGITRPIADNNTAEGRAKNRRVVARVATEVTTIVEE